MKSWIACARFVVLALTLCAATFLSLPAAEAQQKFDIKPVAETKIKQLPAGPLYWRVENLPTLAEAKAAAGDTSLAAEISGKAWLFTLARKGGATPGASKVAEIGPVPVIEAPEYLLRINHAGGPPGAKTPVHSHPGSEAFYVLKGRLGMKTPNGVMHAELRQDHERTPCRHADGGVQCRRHGSRSDRHVPGGCNPAVLVARQVRVIPPACTRPWRKKAP